MRRDIFSSSITDGRTRTSLREFWSKYQILLEPHGVVAWQGSLDWCGVEPLGNTPAVIVETANPAKFPQEVEKVVGWAPDVPAAMTAAIQLPEDYDRMGADYEQFRSYLLARHAGN